MNLTQSLPIKIAMRQYNIDYNSWPIDWLANYIEKKQRKTITENSIAIRHNFTAIKNSSACRNTIFQQLDELFTGSVNRLWAHMKKEEENLFPIIREMLHAKELNRCINLISRDKSESIMEVLNGEHEIESRQLKLSTQLRDNYKVWESSNKHIKALYNPLVLFEQDLELHIYLQNKFLFPKLRLLATA